MPTNPLAPTPTDDEALASGRDTIALVEEVAHVEKVEHVTGRVRVTTRVDTETELVRMALDHDTVDVVRVAKNIPVDVPPGIRTEGDVTIVPVLEEVIVVEKRLVLKEELHIRRKTVTEMVEEPVTVRKQRAVVERQDAAGNALTDPTPPTR